MNKYEIWTDISCSYYAVIAARDGKEAEEIMLNRIASGIKPYRTNTRAKDYESTVLLANEQ
jgi:hypothetical protein